MADQLPDDKDLQAGKPVSAGWMRAFANALRTLMNITAVAPLAIHWGKSGWVIRLDKPILRGLVTGKPVDDIDGITDNMDGTFTPGTGSVKVWREKGNGDLFESDETILGNNRMTGSITAASGFCLLALNGNGDYIFVAVDCGA